MTVISVDPGGARIGIAFWGENGDLFHKHIWLFEDVIDNLMEINEPITTVVVESYRNRGVEKRGSSLMTVQVIGMMKLFAKQQGAAYWEQNPDILRVSAAHTGTEIPAKGHIRDDISAYLHGHYFFVTKGILKARDLW